MVSENPYNYWAMVTYNERFLTNNKYNNIRI